MVADIVKAKTAFDRRIARVSVARLYDAVPGAITRVLRLYAEAERIRKSTDMRAAEKRVALAAIALQHDIIERSILSRTLPTVQRVDHRVLAAMLPASQQDLDEQAAEAAAGGRTAEAEQKAAVLAALRESVRARAIGIVRPIDEARRAS